MKHPGEPTEPPPVAACDRCGRAMALTELQWLRSELLCDACLREEENCGCGDDDPED